MTAGTSVTKPMHQTQKLGVNKRIKLDPTSDAPRDLLVTDIVQSHATELRALTKAVQCSKPKVGSSGPLQSLPRHMRRRAASHNINRLPRRIRQKINANKVPKPRKAPSRFHRRRAGNLMAEFTRRQQRVHWLETHIWHAKRFHMTERWGYKLPAHPTDKGDGAAYRATKNHCLIQDISYHHCLQVAGPADSVLTSFSRVLPSDNETPLDPLGDRAQHCVLYQQDSYPAGAVAAVDVMVNLTDDQVQVWVWCHTAAFTDVWDLLSTLFNIQPSEGELEVQSVDDPITMRSLRDELIRFSLQGKTTAHILTRMLTVSKLVMTSEQAKSHWWTAEDVRAHSDTYTDKSELYTALLNAPDNSVCGLTVRDPRLCMPTIQSEQKAHGEYKNLEKHAVIGSASPLWRSEVREVVSGWKLTDHEINQRRADLLIPGGELELGSLESKVPVLLRKSKLGYDLVLPATWGMKFWLAAIYSGARAGGIRDQATTYDEFGVLQFPTDFPDTPLGAQMESIEAQELTAKHFRYPKNKRPNHDKLVVPSPFRYDWKAVSSKPSVLRSPQAINHLHDQITTCRAGLCSSTFEGLVAVDLHMIGRGITRSRALIALPTPEDMVVLKTDVNCYGPQEPLYKGPVLDRDSEHSVTAAGSLCSTRETIGYVKHGGFSPQTGRGRGFGFVSCTALCKMIENNHILHQDDQRIGLIVLVRSNDSRQYRYASLNVSRL